MTQFIVGTGYGQVFFMDLQLPRPKQKVLKIGNIKKQRITSITFCPKQENGFFYLSEKNIFKGSLNNATEQLVQSYTYSQEKLIGLSYQLKKSIPNDYLFHAFNNGAINLVYQNLQTQEYEMKQVLKAKIPSEQLCDKKHYNKFIFDGVNKHCLIGRQVPPFIFDEEKKLITWTGKNVPNDELDLRVEVNDVDGVFFKKGSSLACAHVNNKVRIYDVRSNKQKPSADYHLKLDKVYNKSYLTKIHIQQQKKQNLFYIANDVGAVYECDIRKSMQVVGKFKGISTTITDMQTFENKIYISSLDCYVSAFDIQSKQLVDKYYMNKPIYSLKLRKNNTKELQQYEQQALSEEEENLLPTAQESKKMKKLRKRNKVNLKYLKEVNWDEVPIDPELLKQAKQEYEEINEKDADRYLNEDENNEYVVKNEHDSDEERDSDLD